MLTAGGVLPPRDEELARAEQWLTALLAAIEPGRRPAARAGLCHLAGDAPAARQRRSRRRPRTPTAHARNNIRAAASLLAWLRGRGTDAGGLPPSRHRPMAAHRARRPGWRGTSWPGPPHAATAGPLTIPAAAARDRPGHQPGPPMGADRPAAARRQPRSHRPGRRMPAAALRPAAVPHRRHDHQPGHPPRRRRRSSGSAATTCRSPDRSPAPSASSSATAAATAASDPRPPPPGCSPATCPAARSPRPGSANACAPSASTPRPAAAPRCSTSPPSCRRRPRRPPRPARDTAARWMHQAGGDWSRYAAELARPSSPALTNTSPPRPSSRGIQHGW